MKKKISAFLLSLSLAMILPSIPLHAETPTVIYSTIEGGSVEIGLDNAIYPITGSSTRSWTFDGTPIVPDGVNVIDTSEGQRAKLKFISATTAQHAKDITVSDTTEPVPAEQIIPNQVARLYVISKVNYNAATLTTKPLNASIGDEIYAKDLTLYIDSTPYPNFYPLRFKIGSSTEEKITVTAGTNTYNLVDIVENRTTTIQITGVADAEAPKITSLTIADGMADKYALKKTLKVTASDNIALAADAYYWEDNANLATVIKQKIMEGNLASDLTGITWTSLTSHEVANNGIYTIFVRDDLGNIAYKDITVSKISSSSPYISSVTLGKEDGKAYLEVKATDSANQPLSYKLNDKDWQSSNKLFGVKEGTNTVYVKNEAGVEVSATKEVFLSIFLQEEEGFSPSSLYNYIQVSPVGWTNNQVIVSLVIPDSLQNRLSSAPYSINGGSYSSSRSITILNNDETVQFTVKDIYGNNHTSSKYTVKNIDKEAPSLEVTSSDGVISVKAQDIGSGIKKITVNSTNATNFVIKANDAPGVMGDFAAYKAPANGSYQFTVYDFAGNISSASYSIKDYTKEGSVQALVKDSKTGGDRSGTATGGKSGSSTLGTKASAKKTGTRAVAVKEERGFTSFSTAGNTEMKEDLPEVEEIEYVKISEKTTSEPAQKIQHVALDNSNNDKVKKMVMVLLPMLTLGTIVAVIIINAPGIFIPKKK